jgi:hypothetical protein
MVLMMWMMTDIPSGRASYPAYFAAGHSNHHWMVQRWTLSAVLRLHWQVIRIVD